jgi:hypothetical protein
MPVVLKSSTEGLPEDQESHRTTSNSRWTESHPLLRRSQINAAVEFIDSIRREHNLSPIQFSIPATVGEGEKTRTLHEAASILQEAASILHETWSAKHRSSSRAELIPNLPDQPNSLSDRSPQTRNGADPAPVFTLNEKAQLLFLSSLSIMFLFGMAHIMRPMQNAYGPIAAMIAIIFVIMNN